MYKRYLAVNNHRGLICHLTKWPNLTYPLSRNNKSGYLVYLYKQKQSNPKNQPKHQQLCQLRLKNTPTAPLKSGKTPPHKCPMYDTKPSDCEILVLEF